MIWNRQSFLSTMIINWRPRDLEQIVFSISLAVVTLPGWCWLSPRYMTVPLPSSTFVLAVLKEVEGVDYDTARTAALSGTLFGATHRTRTWTSSKKFVQAEQLYVYVDVYFDT